MRVILLTLLFLALSTAAQGSVLDEDTITTGNWNDYHPSLSRKPLGDAPYEWLVFDRQTDDSSFIVARRFIKYPPQWDTSDVIIARSNAADMLSMPDISIKNNYGLIAWQKRTKGKWNLFYSMWSQPTQTWSSPSALTNDTLDNTNVRVLSLGIDSQFVAAWQNGRILRLRRTPFSLSEVSDTVAISNIDSTEFDIGIGAYSQSGTILYEISAATRTNVVLLPFTLYPSLSLGTPDTVETYASIHRPRFVQEYSSFQRFTYDRKGSITYSSYVCEFSNNSSSIQGVSTTENDTYSCGNARAYVYPYIAHVGKFADRVLDFPYNQLVVYERTKNFPPGNATIGIMTLSTYTIIASDGYNRNPVLGTTVLSVPGQSGGKMLLVWESNRTGKNHLYGTLVGSFGYDGVQEPQNVPAEFALMQNYPNPFNPSTMIDYSILQPCTVSIKVYDVIGREIVTLVNDFKPAGRHRVSFDASDLSSGMYFYKMQAGAYTAVKKMQVLH